MPTLLRSLLWIVLGGWIGSWALFAFAVAPLAFQVLPSAREAGLLTGPLLQGLHLYGAAAGVLLAALSGALRRRGLLILLPLGLSALCLMSQLAVTPAMEAVLPSAFGPATGAGAAARFAWLHQLSKVLYGTVGCGTLLLAVLHARADAASARR